MATRQGTTLRALVEEGLRKVVAEKRRPDGFHLRRASFRGEGLQPQAAGIGWDRLREMAYEGHGG